ncbi:hypothetical protein [Kineococcus sp. SYSU DK003]|uniref:hypothetical protein n=1 Tax=Kineococcus sp. SYSU DK003 TaxID=3383124 RepID=UPI003D7E56ED
MFSSAAPGPRVVGFTRDAGRCRAPGCRHPLPDGAALVATPDGAVHHYGPACVRRALGVHVTVDDLVAIEARRHAAFVMGLAFAHAAFVAEDLRQCTAIARTLDALAPASVAERVVLENVRTRLRTVGRDPRLPTALGTVEG